MLFRLTADNDSGKMLKKGSRHNNWGEGNRRTRVLRWMERHMVLVQLVKRVTLCLGSSAGPKLLTAGEKERNTGQNEKRANRIGREARLTYHTKNILVSSCGGYATNQELSRISAHMSPPNRFLRGRKRTEEARSGRLKKDTACNLRDGKKKHKNLRGGGD